MLETFTPAVCGSRKRQIVAQALFALSAVAAAAALGLALGLLGAALGGERAVLAAAGLALVAAAREAGLVRFPVPQARRQVPERWRFELPLPLWSSGYGAGLGAGFFTFQPVSTYWVACAGALALARPLPAALCFSLYGAGRALMVVWPRRQEADPTAAVERLVTRRGALLRANVVALLACAVLLAAAPAAGGAVVESALDPSASGRALAFATQSGDVVVREGGTDTVFPDASQPALSGDYLAYVDAQGIAVVRWRTGEEVTRVDNPNASLPALGWPNVAYVRRDSERRRIIVKNLVTGTSTRFVSARLSTDLGRPSLRHGRLAWHVVTRSSSRIIVLTLSSGRRRTIAVSRIAHLTNPSLHYKKVIWVDARSKVTRLRQGRVDSRSTKVLATVKGRGVRYWTTSLSPDLAYFTRWTVRTGAADIRSRSL